MSSNKTANLQLNQWAAGDAFLREEFNQDNSKVDAAVGAVRTQIQAIQAGSVMVRLGNFSITTPVQAVDIDLSAIRVSDFSEIRLIGRGLSAVDGPPAGLTVNDDRTQGHYSTNSGFAANTSGVGAMFRLPDICTDRDSVGTWIVNIYPLQKGISLQAWSGRGSYDSTTVGFCHGNTTPASAVNAGNLKKLTLTANGVNFTKGALSVYGIKI